MFKQKINLDRHSPEPYPNIWHFPDHPNFSLPTTFKRHSVQVIKKTCPLPTRTVDCSVVHQSLVRMDHHLLIADKKGCLAVTVNQLKNGGVQFYQNITSIPSRVNTMA